MSAIRYETRRKGLPELSFQVEWYIQQVRKGIRKMDRREPLRKQPMTRDRLDEVFRVCDVGNNFRHRQYLTMGYVAHDSLMRAGELLNIRRGDVTFNTDGSISLRIRCGKASGRWTDGNPFASSP